VAGLQSDEILPLLLREEVAEVTEFGQSVKAVSVVAEGPILMKSSRTFSFGMIYMVRSLKKYPIL